jgi:hypothetical protein
MTEINEVKEIMFEDTTGEKDLIKDEVEEKQDITIKDRVGGNILDPSPGFLAIELPCGYIHDGELNTLALVREMEGAEEDIIVGKGPAVQRLNAVIANCLVSLGPIKDRNILRMVPDKLTSPDRMVLIIALRRVTVGDFWDLIITCPKEGCNCKMHKTIDLRDVAIRPMKDRMARDNEFILPKSGKLVKWRVQGAEDEQWLADASKKKEDLLTLQMMSRVYEFDGVALDRKIKFKEAKKILKTMKWNDRSALRYEFERVEADVDTKAEYICDECGYEWETGLDFSQESFFFPSAH